MSAFLAVGLLVTVAPAQMSPWRSPRRLSGIPRNAGRTTSREMSAAGSSPLFSKSERRVCAFTQVLTRMPALRRCASPHPLWNLPCTSGNLCQGSWGGVNIQFNNGDVAGITSARNDFTLQGVWLELTASTFAHVPKCGVVFLPWRIFFL